MISGAGAHPGGPLLGPPLPALAALGLALGSAALAGLGAWGADLLGTIRAAARSPLAARSLPGAGLDTADRARLAALLPGRAVGGMRTLPVGEVVPAVVAPADLTVVAADPAWVRLADLTPVHGRPLDEADEAAGAAVCLVSSALAERIEGAHAGAALRLDGTWWTPVGLLPAGASDGPDVVVPLRSGSLRLAPAAEAALDELLVEAPEGVAALAPVVSRALARADGTGGARVGPASDDGSPVGQGRAGAVLLALLAGTSLGLGACAGRLVGAGRGHARRVGVAAGVVGALPGAWFFPALLGAPQPSAAAAAVGVALGLAGAGLAALAGWPPSTLRPPASGLPPIPGRAS